MTKTPAGLQPTIRITDSTVELAFDWCQLSTDTQSGLQRLDFAIEECLQLDVVKDLNPGSDYTEQYFDIHCSADSVTIIFRKEKIL